MNIEIRSLLPVLLAVLSSTVLPAETKPFDQTTLEALQAANKPVLIDVYADWCPTCKQQEPILSELLARPEFKDYTVLRVNFDSQKAVRRALGVAQQSTFIVYRGKREVARSTGDTNKDSIAATLRKALS
jgi:thiol:disulfide interchange protein